MAFREKTFSLKDLDEKVWEKVILIEIDSSSSYEDDVISIFTSDKKEYFIYLACLGDKRDELYQRVPILKRDYAANNGKYPFETEENGWKKLHAYIWEYFVREDFYDVFKEQFNKKKQWGNGYFFIPIIEIVSTILRCENDELEKLDYEGNNEWREKKRKEYEEHELEREKMKLTDADFIWKTIHINNVKSNGENGLYSLIFKEMDGAIIGYKFSIVYQREQISPLHYDGKDSKIEMYILFEKRYDDIQGPLDYAEDKELLEFDENNFIVSKKRTFTDTDINHYGEFLRAFNSLKEAKEYAIDVANIRGYANKSNLIRSDKNIGK